MVYGEEVYDWEEQSDTKRVGSVEERYRHAQ
jgi:hypothetical protein